MNPDIHALPEVAASVRTEPKIGPAHAPASPEVNPSSRLLMSPVAIDVRSCTASEPGIQRATSNPNPKICSTPKVISTMAATMIIGVRYALNSCASAPTPSPSGTSTATMPTKNTSECTTSRAPEPATVPKYAGSNNAEHGLNNARVPPMNAATTPISMRPLCPHTQRTSHSANLTASKPSRPAGLRSRPGYSDSCCFSCSSIFNCSSMNASNCSVGCAPLTGRVPTMNIGVEVTPSCAARC